MRLGPPGPSAPHNAEATGVRPSRPMDFALLACDEITGLIIAVALVRPTKRRQSFVTNAPCSC